MWDLCRAGQQNRNPVLSQEPQKEEPGAPLVTGQWWGWWLCEPQLRVEQQRRESLPRSFLTTSQPHPALKPEVHTRVHSHAHTRQGFPGGLPGVPAEANTPPTSKVPAYTNAISQHKLTRRRRKHPTPCQGQRDHGAPPDAAGVGQPDSGCGAVMTHLRE